MNLLELVTQSRQTLDDFSEPFLWSDLELIGYINQALIEAVIRSRMIVDSTTALCCEIDIIEGVADYLLHPSIFQIKSIFESSGYFLKKIGQVDLEKRDANWKTRAGKPLFFLNDLDHFQDNHKITLYPIPNGAFKLGLTVYRTPLLELKNDNDIPEIPGFHHRQLINWVLYLAYMKQDADGLNAGKSLSYENKFTQYFGDSQSARKMEWRRKYSPTTITSSFF